MVVSQDSVTAGGFPPPQRTPRGIGEGPTTCSGRKAFAQSLIITWYQSWFTSANHYKKNRIANVLTLALDMFMTHI